MDVDGYPDKYDFDELRELDGKEIRKDFSIILAKFSSCGSGSGKLYKSKDELGKEVLTLDLHTG